MPKNLVDDLEERKRNDKALCRSVEYALLASTVSSCNARVIMGDMTYKEAFNEVVRIYGECIDRTLKDDARIDEMYRLVQEFANDRTGA